MQLKILNKVGNKHPQQRRQKEELTHLRNQKYSSSNGIKEITIELNLLS